MLTTGLPIGWTIFWSFWICTESTCRSRLELACWKWTVGLWRSSMDCERWCEREICTFCSIFLIFDLESVFIITLLLLSLTIVVSRSLRASASRGPSSWLEQSAFDGTRHRIISIVFYKHCLNVKLFCLSLLPSCPSVYLENTAVLYEFVLPRWGVFGFFVVGWEGLIRS